MTELIKISQHEGNQAVSARDLHTFLESRQQFADWIKNRIDKYGLIEGQDYLLHNFMKQHATGAKHITEYILTLDTAKELAMVEGNDKGRQARRYFIACEKQLRELHEASQTQVSDNAQPLLEIMYNICQIKEHNLRIQLCEKVMNLQASGIGASVDKTPKTEHTEACRMIVLQAVDTYYRDYMRTFMNHKGLATGAAILEMAYNYIKAHKIPIRSRRHTTFYDDMANAIKIHEIKYLPVTGRPLKEKLRDYDRGVFITELVKAKNMGNQNAKRV